MTIPLILSNRVCKLFKTIIQTPKSKLKFSLIGKFFFQFQFKIVFPRFKKEPLNYRPVSLTCIICKVFEQIIRSNIEEFLNNSISDQQHGFGKDKSCLTNLLETIRVRMSCRCFLF